jgi:chorismate-pyruvate lyase
MAMGCSDRSVNIIWLSLNDAQKQLSQPDFTKLADHGSLTRRIRTACPELFELKLIDQKIINPNEDERALLDLDPTAQVLSRRIYLCCGDQAKIFAKTIIGLTVKNKLLIDRINTLGEQSLGSILFKDPLAKKRVMHLALIPYAHAFFAGVDQIGSHPENASAWVRRSVYEYEGCDLAVYEAFLRLQEPKEAP